jgi:hypothetical protein
VTSLFIRDEDVGFAYEKMLDGVTMPRTTIVRTNIEAYMLYIARRVAGENDSKMIQPKKFPHSFAWFAITLCQTVEIVYTY